MAQLSHANVIGLHDFVRSGDRWLVLESIDGHTLAELLDKKRSSRRSRPPPSRAP